mgnify:CR=1 FL=1
MQLEVVNIEDVYPDENNPRQKFDGIDELAESFELNKERPGEPFTPPILVRDGGIYRIVDGERRYKALKKRRKTSFTANVCDDMDEANTLMAMLATDNKQPLSDLEKSRGVQQMLLLGVDPVQVDKTTKGAHAKRIKRAMDKIGDAAEDMTLDRMLAIDEFSDDPSIVEQLTTCTEKTWEGIADNARRERKIKNEMAAIKEALINKGYRVVDEQPEDYYYNDAIRRAKDVEAINDDPNEVVFKLDSYYGRSYEKFKYRPDNKKNNEQIAAIRKMKDDIRESEEHRAIWFGDRLENPSKIPSLAKIARDAFVYNNSMVLDHYKDDLQVDLECEPCKLALVVGYERSHSSIAPYADDILDGTPNKWIADRFYDYCKVLDALIKDGYKPEVWESELFAKIYAARDRAKEAMDNA